jgi:hypothetical protein
MAAMNKDTTRPVPGAGATPEKQALLEAFDTVLKKQAEVREAERRVFTEQRRKRNRVRPSLWVAACFTMFLSAYLYIERPEWLFPTAAAPERVAIKEASLRIGMANVAQHVERYRQRTGRLPRTLSETGTQVDGITYQPLDSTWRLVGRNGGVEIALASSDPLPRFLGNSFELIARRSR